MPLLKYAIATAVTCASMIQVSSRVTSKVPASLVGLIFSSVMAITLKWPVKTLADVAGKGIFSGGLHALPQLSGLPSVALSAAAWGDVLSTATGIAVIAILETLLANRIACDNYRCRVDVYEKDDPDRTSVGLGLGTAASALFGGFGGCGLIPNTLLNGKSGGEGYASGYSYALSLALSVLVFAPIIGRIPMAALAGLMLTVAANTFDWNESLHLVKSALKTGSSQSYSDLLGMIVTMGLCYKVDMGIGVFAGVLITNAMNISNGIRKGMSLLLLKSIKFLLKNNRKKSSTTTVQQS